MKKTHILGLALFAVLAFSAIPATSAFAEAELLLTAKPITTAIPASSTGELSLTDLTSLGEATVDCSGILDGTIQAGGKDFLVESLLTLAGTTTIGSELTGTELSCTGLGLCEESVLASVWTEHLPWLVSLELMTVGTENKYLFILGEDTETKTGLPAYEVDCTTIAGLVEDLCEGKDSGFLTNEASGLVAAFSLTEQESDGEEAVCNFTKEKTGHLQGSGTITSTSGALTVSE